MNYLFSFFFLLTNLQIIFYCSEPFNRKEEEIGDEGESGERENREECKDRGKVKGKVIFKGRKTSLIDFQ